jgi:secreted protein with Ig-like and vWFA domain
MSAANENHEPVQIDDLHDRLMDIALTETVGGKTPPDLSSRIAAARDAARPSRPEPVVAGDRSHWMRWLGAAIAATLLVGATLFLISSGQQRHNSAGASKIAKAENSQLKQRQHQLSLPAIQRPAGEAEARSADGNVDFDSLADLVESTTSAQPAAGGESGPAAAPMDLAISQTPSVPVTPYFQAEGDAPTAGPSATTWGVRSEQRRFRYTGERAYPEPYFGTEPQLTVKTDDGADLVTPLTENQSGPGGPPTPSSAALVTESYAFNDRREDVLRDVSESEVSGEASFPNFTTDNKAQRGWKKLEELATIRAKDPNGIGPGRGGDKYVPIVENPFIKAEGGAAVSTFSIDVDTASYSNVRQFLMESNQLPPPDAVRIEELVNYFEYDYPGPAGSPQQPPAEPGAANDSDAAAATDSNTPAAPGSAGGSDDEAPFAAHVEVATCPWAPEHRLARIAVKGREMDRTKRPQSNLVFLVDVSGSMNEPAKLPLVVYGLERLTKELGENDHIAIVVYASSEGLVLPSTSGTKQREILAALGKLQAGGSTAGGAGIQLAYQIAEDNFIKGGTNRVILCTDGDFNVGVTSTADLQRLVEKKAADTGVFLSVLGFGRGNLNDAMMEAIADHGNGNYSYVDNRTEARRVLVEQMTGTLVTIAKDVKIQVEFNPTKAAGYRLVGYENRMLRTEDFNDDKKDAGEIGAGHTVTALYEIVPAGKKVGVAPVDELKYQKSAAANPAAESKTEAASVSDELLTLKMRYKAPDGDTGKKLEWPVKDDAQSFADASDDYQFAAAVAGFGLMLRDSQYKGNLKFPVVLELAQGGLGRDEKGYRSEFLDIVRKAQQLKGE